MKRIFSSILLSGLVVAGVAGASTTTVWVDGVTEQSGWTDYNKVNPEANDGDNNLCWAAAASNVINWWQNQYAAVTKNAPQDEEIWNTFKNSSSDSGGSTFCAFQWWLTGEYSATENPIDNREYAYYGVAEDPAIENRTINGGQPFDGFYRESSLPSNEYHYYPWNYELKEFMYSVSVGDVLSVPSGLGKTVAEQLTGGAAATVSITNLNKEGHAITLWGVEYDNTTGDLCGMWLTDSDDNQYGMNTDGLFYAALEETEAELTVDGVDGMYKLLTFDVKAGDWYYKGSEFTNDTLYISEIEFFDSSVTDGWTLQSIPEPATATLGLVALAGLTLRRRRRH